MKDFLKMSLATVVGLIAFSAVSFVFSLIFLLGIATAFGGSEPKIASEGILKVDMSTFTLTEQSTESNPIEMISGGETMVGNIGIWDAVRSINAAANDPAVKFIYLLPDAVMGGTAQIEEFRAALQNFKNSGKAVISFIENPTNAGYYLASVSDKIYMTPYEGLMNNLTGVSSQMIFLKDILDKIGINVQLIRHGKYKSAGEMFIRSTSSKENLEQNEAMVKSVWESIGTSMAQSREISFEQLNSLLDNLNLNSAQDFINEGLVDEALSREELGEKLATFYVKIGYPDKWQDYSKLVVDPKKSFFENSVEAQKFFWADHVEKKFKKPVDNTEWFMTPQTVNAYYNPTTNEICFPAGILQYPFFDMEEDDAFNYGAIGVVIGHEMTHGFDDQGRQFDKDGNFVNWWTDEDAKMFNERTQVIVDFFDKIEVLPGLNANGKLTLGENIADHGGIMISLQAFRNATKDNPQPVIDGLTAEQRFFISYSGVWAGHVRDEEIRNLTKSDVHSLSRWRVNGTLPHIDAWYEAFGITEESPMFVPQEERLNIW